MLGLAFSVEGSDVAEVTKRKQAEQQLSGSAGSPLLLFHYVISLPRSYLPPPTLL